jgi:hypothetical protein
MVGIPFTLSVIADIGQIFATMVSAFWKRYKHILLPIVDAIKNFQMKKSEKLIGNEKFARFKLD